ncbi:MAG: ABC transporter permease [Geminicoccaceae bacterium]
MAGRQSTPIDSGQGLRAWLEAEQPQSLRQARAQRAWRGWQSFLDHRLGVIGLVIVVALVLVALLAPWIATYDPIIQQMDERLLPPSAAHWLGTDHLGRDVYSRIVWGARTTLRIAVLVAIIVAPIGLAVGATAGYLGGIADEILMRVTDVFLAFPGLILALGFAAALGPGINNAIIAIALTAWPPIARLARAEALTIRGSDYIAAVRLQGASRARLIARHVVPMCLPSVVVRVTLNMAGVILTAAGLGFLGLGAQPPWPEWGAMVAVGRQFMFDSPWVVAAPGIAIAIVSLAFNLFGDALRDMLDPRST